jgi:hypothetical protein
MVAQVKNLINMGDKKYKWKCSTCSDEIFTTKQPLCKPCSHIERQNVEMDKVVCKVCDNSGINGDGICLPCGENIDD